VLPLAEQGNAGAQAMLGEMYGNGEGVPQNYAEALKWVREAADQGDAQGQYDLGYSYDSGKGVPQDYAEAAKWYRLAAKQGNAKAHNSIGFMYANGQGVTQDYVEAVRCYRLAPDQGEALAQSNLGLMYAQGHGVPQDYVIAHMWLNLSAAQGYGNAISEPNSLSNNQLILVYTTLICCVRQWRASWGNGPQSTSAYRPTSKPSKIKSDSFAKSLNDGAGKLSSNTATLAYRAVRAAMIVPASIRCSRMPSADASTL
jgi:X-X-X-Leu-X-X-Gly heptad repeat protein